ncbi:MAG: hypothetical protein E6Q76_05580 [Rhizobium sp.]|nr:MAG: hypothetical protein E6Q76_05580 [Rhizobium sp.]
MIRLNKAALLMVLSSISFACAASGGGSETPANPDPTSLNRTLLSETCPAGQALSGIENDFSNGTQQIHASCRPVPANRADGTQQDWCGKAPPSDVDCSCDVQNEKLQWAARGSCWVCVGTGKHC